MTELRDNQTEIWHFRLRALAVGALVLVAFCLVLARLVFLQVLRHEDLAAQAESNRTAVLPIVPGRGLILDRNGVVLATNYSAYTLEITPARVAALDETIDELAKVVEIQARDRRRFKRLLEESRNFESLPIRTRLTDQEVARFAAQRYRFPGVDIRARLFRSYPLGDVASHAIGYIGRINQSEKARIQDSDDEANYRGTEYIGKLGIEQSFESALHGATGVERMETSAGGRAVRKLASHAATPGDTVVLALDIRLQKMIEDLFGERRGALVALDPRSGEVLALVSKPTFDPNLFVEGIDADNWAALNESIDKPLLNRALRGTYPPGSTYKPFMALAALQLGKRSPSLVVNDPGSYTFGGHTFRSHEGGLGGVDMQRALQLSSNTYFYSLAVEMGVDNIHDFMQPLGFGQATGIDLQGEVPGTLPSTDWKRKTYRRADMQRWFPGETVSLGIGQGYNSFTMLQLAVAQATLANGGTRYRPHLAKAVKNALTGAVTEVAQPPGANLGYLPRNVDIVRNALVAVNKDGTSARVFAGAAYTSAGKTGTAQAVSLGPNVKYNAKALAEHLRDHALFTAFAPAEAPSIALALIVENAGFGAAHAAPIARRVFDYWLMGEYPSEEDIAAVQKGLAGAPIGKPRKVDEVPLVRATVAP
ncbi:penicillin-binding protein 2 [Verminephrobacter eiseniae]|uniref:penicillin-binding protein 2 n=1 Tax=Verminephrobacter eiseniae TaxID=364317 RepID=UPI0010E954A2|nr:penicillin-binding protein 2 [Verminephrobacter eiseniae]KAB7619462.1 penicillin-binding protein 2 [Verminephrobacter sp. Larva24]MCW5234367.1 penicillin-binding protein 2 [Verminephrobacter eiseniae]MCW5294057.1 penicillin-binding protein 2 [Verminephrobacter eiseniae]MCW8183205.1 penicillin-binding protein 2 [Verminephrobacter eiseniae]MCW8222146.1 penicillin-binding protein 2 [Verminephrobacter eiseniae]